MSNPAKDPLRELFKRELDAFAVESTGTEGIISSGRIEALTGLAKLIETRDSLQRKPRNWLAALVLLVTLVAASVLLFARVSETEIELDVSLAQLSFALAEAQVLSGPVNLSALGISGLRDVQLPQSPSRSVSAGTDYAAPAVSLTPSSAGERRGSLTLAPLVLPAGARLKLGRSDVANQYQLSTNATNLIFQAAAYGPIRISLPGSPARAIDFATPKTVLMRGGSEEVSLDLTFPTLPQSPLSPQLEVRDIAFSRVDQFLEANQTLVKRLSTILSGTLSFESLNGQELRLRPGEELQVEHSQGEIRSLELAANHIDFKFHGRVSGMAAGTGEGHRSIMPTYLEWLKARHGLSLLWATSLYIFGLVAAALRWFGVRL
jgi:hypothetical protein